MLWVLLVAPLVVLAQDVHDPPATTGNNGSAPAEESIETAPGIAWYAAILLGSVVFAALLAALLLRQDRLDKRRP
jgi:hypothetical protein